MTEHYPEPSVTRVKIEEIQAENDKAVQRLATLGAEVDIDSVEKMRNAKLLDWIFTNLLTEAQREDFLLEWHIYMAEQLKGLEGKAREHYLAQSRVAKQQARPSGLIVPGHVRRPGS